LSEDILALIHGLMLSSKQKSGFSIHIVTLEKNAANAIIS
jgi:hypothetical protein